MDGYRRGNVCCKNNWEYLTRLFDVVVEMNKKKK